LATLLNANGLTAMVAMLAAELSGDPQKVVSVLNAQYAHLECLPPFDSIPPPPPATTGS
jgi:hypothetical protein